MKNETNIDFTPPCAGLFRHVPELIAALKAQYPEAVCALEHGGDPWRLLVMSILSAQCTDKRVNLVSVALFERFKTPQDIARAEVTEVEEYVRSCGLYRTKAKNIRNTCVMLCERYDGKVPREMDELLILPGVGRKIANLIRGDVYRLPAIVADTHCIRLSSRLGFTPGSTDPLKVERTLKAAIPENEQSDFCHRLVMLGREYCTARSPKCDKCPLAKL